MNAADSEAIKIAHHLEAGIVSFENRRQKMWRSVLQGQKSIKYVSKCFRSQCSEDQIRNDRGIHVFFNIICTLGGGVGLHDLYMIPNIRIYDCL